MNLSAAAIAKALNNQWQEAIDLNEQIIASDPKNIDALNRLAQAYLHIGNLNKAKITYNLVLAIDRFNPIAKRNLNKLKDCQQNSQHADIHITRPFTFIEEPGKTKVVTLVQTGDRSTLSTLSPCLSLKMKIRKQSICLYHNKNYVGRLPDNVAKRLIWLCKRDNKYDIFLKSLEKNKISVFIRESKRSLKNNNHPSFIAIADKSMLYQEESDQT